MKMTLRTLWGHVVAAMAMMVLTISAASAQAPKGDPIKVGFSMSLTGAVAPNGQQLLRALEIWRDDVNAAGGLLGRPVELIHYDDQSTPANVPAIYQKLLSVDKVDLLLGPYSTNMAAPAMPVIMQAGKTTISMLAIGVNRHFDYDRYFSMVPVSSEGVASFSKGFFELAAAQSPKPVTVAMVAADAEFARTAADGAKENAKKLGFKIVYDRSYPPTNTDFAPIMRAVQAANADIVFVAAYPPDTVGIIRSANEIGLKPKMFGGTMIGLLATPLKVQLGPLTNNLVIMESFTPIFKFPGLQEVLAKYREKAARAEDRSVRLRLRSVRLRGRTDPRQGRDRDQGPRPRQDREIHPRQHLRHRRRAAQIRQGRRMGRTAYGVFAIPECAAE